MGTTEGIELLGGMGRARAERARNIEQMAETVVAAGLNDQVEVRHLFGSSLVHLWVTDRGSGNTQPRVAIASLSPTEARKVAVLLRTAANRIDTGDTGRTAR